MRRKRSNTLLPPHGVRALVPVFGVQGGAGRSTVTGLLAQLFAPSTRTVVFDTAHRSGSPWADWLGVGTKIGEQGGLPGLASLGRVPDRAALTEAKARRKVPVRRGEALTGVEPGEEPGYDVLADLRPFTRPPVEAPEDPRWYAKVVENGGWFTGIVEYSVNATAKHIEARNASRQSMLDQWFTRQDAVPLLVATSAAAGPSRLRQLANLLDQDGLDPKRAVAAIVDVTGGDRPKWLPGEMESLAGRFGLVVQVPFDKTIHNDELTRLDAVGSGTLTPVKQLAEKIVTMVRHQPATDDQSSAGQAGDMDAYRAEVLARQEASDPMPAPTPVAPAPKAHPGQQAPGWVPKRG